MSKSILQVIYSCSVQKNRLKKHKILEKWDHFGNQQSCKAYSLFKIVTLDQKLKFQKTCQNLFYKWFTVVLCKKPLEKTLNIREMRPVWKSSIMQSPLQNRHFESKIKISTNICQNLFYKWFTVVLCKKPLKKHQIFEKWDRFENRPSYKAYSLWKIVTLGQKLKF